MAGEDGFSEVGGGGSVNWKVDVNDGNLVQTKRKGETWGYTVSDKDDVGDRPLKNEYFKIAIKQPEGAQIQWKRANGGVVLYLPITDDPKQIRVSWAHERLPMGLAALDPEATLKSGGKAAATRGTKR